MLNLVTSDALNALKQKQWKKESSGTTIKDVHVFYQSIIKETEHSRQTSVITIGCTNIIGSCGLIGYNRLVCLRFALLCSRQKFNATHHVCCFKPAEIFDNLSVIKIFYKKLMFTNVVEA
ncbi:hypothetical protein L596_019741 [Steinernema carpocapsae]|uniref:Uncharacterized protein n=1 Tax=Steinernema carpocapsae TaxID=34508 RepID=A0A4U5MRG3_STECR|nr:hypothetical protein L596_019741 [Steinernema carpocapsae]